MVAKITVPNSIRIALNYNEQKMKEGKAECIYAHHFLKEAEQLNFYEKLGRFQSLIDLNKRATTNTVHISVNFGLEEKIERNKLAEIASAYMEKIGFGAQPYLVYQHLDAGHPHIHISVPISKRTGKGSPCIISGAISPTPPEKSWKWPLTFKGPKIKIRLRPKRYTP